MVSSVPKVALPLGTVAGAVAGVASVLMDNDLTWPGGSIPAATVSGDTAARA
jgi:hypothetical protein